MNRDASQSLETSHPARGSRRASHVARTCLRPFEPDDAREGARWVRTKRDLQWLAPGTAPPLTAEKVIAWKKPGGQAFALTVNDSSEPIGYGELNPMGGENGHWWIGHVIVRPDLRGRGLGQAFVRALLDHAFHELAADRVSLIVFPGNRAALDCYRRVGFAPMSEEFHQFGQGGAKNRLLRLEIRRSASPIRTTQHATE